MFHIPDAVWLALATALGAGFREVVRAFRASSKEEGDDVRTFRQELRADLRETRAQLEASQKALGELIAQNAAHVVRVEVLQRRAEELAGVEEECERLRTVVRDRDLEIALLKAQVTGTAPNDRSARGVNHPA
jgi:hypothetical protein